MLLPIFFPLFPECEINLSVKKKGTLNNSLFSIFSVAHLSAKKFKFTKELPQKINVFVKGDCIDSDVV